MRTTSNHELNLIGLQSRLIQPNEDLFAVFQEALERNQQALDEGDIVVAASKVVSVCEGNLKKNDFETIVKQEADKNFDDRLTIKDGIFIPFAGADQSNAPDGCIITWPKRPQSSIDHLMSRLKAEYGLERLGGLIVDSQITPLRQGTIGLALACSGFEGVEDCRGRNDLFGRELTMTTRNVADMLASAASFLMGEADESTPFVVIRNAAVIWTDRNMSPDELKRKPDDCLFKSLY